MNEWTSLLYPCSNNPSPHKVTELSSLLRWQLPRGRGQAGLVVSWESPGSESPEWSADHWLFSPLLFLLQSILMSLLTSLLMMGSAPDTISHLPHFSAFLMSSCLVFSLRQASPCLLLLGETKAGDGSVRLREGSQSSSLHPMCCDGCGRTDKSIISGQRRSKWKTADV